MASESVTVRIKSDYIDLTMEDGEYRCSNTTDGFGLIRLTRCMEKVSPACGVNVFGAHCMLKWMRNSAATDSMDLREEQRCL